MLVPAPNEALAGDFTSKIPTLIRATGPPAYDYQFPDRDFFDAFIKASWLQPRNLFSHTEATLVIEKDELLGMEIGYSGRGWYELKDPLFVIATGLVESGATTRDSLATMFERTAVASYMNPYVPETAYYILVLSVVETHRGSGVGARLLQNSIETARKAGYTELHLDVLSGTPAVEFYRKFGMTCMAETIGPEPCREHGVPMEMRMVLSL